MVICLPRCIHVSNILVEYLRITMFINNPSLIRPSKTETKLYLTLDRQAIHKCEYFIRVVVTFFRRLQLEFGYRHRDTLVSRSHIVLPCLHLD